MLVPLLFILCSRWPFMPSKEKIFLASIALISLWAQFLSLGSSLFRLFVGLLGYFAQKDW